MLYYNQNVYLFHHMFIRMESDNHVVIEVPSRNTNLPESNEACGFSVVSTPDVNDMYDDEESESEPATPDYGAFYEEYLNSLLTVSPLSLDNEATPERSVAISFTKNASNVKRSLFKQ